MNINLPELEQIERLQVEYLYRYIQLLQEEKDAASSLRQSQLEHAKAQQLSQDRVLLLSHQIDVHIFSIDEDIARVYGAIAKIKLLALERAI